MSLKVHGDITITFFNLRYIGSKREVASFQKHNQMGPIVKVIAHRAGKGAVMALLNDPNYEVRQSQTSSHSTY